MEGFSLGASLEVTREVVEASRNRHLIDLMNDPFFESVLKSFRLSLVEQRERLLLAYRGAAYDDIREVILALLNSADNLLQLLPISSGSSWGEIPGDTVEQKMGVATAYRLFPAR